jgi:sulfur-oxidizing protein SoxY
MKLCKNVGLRSICITHFVISTINENQKNLYQFADNNHPMKRFPILKLTQSFISTLALTLGLSAAAYAGIDGLPSGVKDEDSSPQWESIKAKLFPGKQIFAARDRVQLEVPTRAAYGAAVPVKIISPQMQSKEQYVKRLYLIVDKNPSPVAAIIDYSLKVGHADLETRLRVDEYSHIRAIIELSDGQLFSDARYVKVSGGCSAPPNRDNPSEIGKTVFRLPEATKQGEEMAVNVMVRHPNDTGFELNNITVMYIPPHFIRTIDVTFNGEPVMKAEMDFSIAENPNLRFKLLADKAGELKAEVEDSKEQRFVGTASVKFSP